jgi:DNA-binding beta-propeller fold protein YncE
MAHRKWQMANQDRRPAQSSSYLLFAICPLLFLASCSTPPGVLFDRADTVHRWPPPPDQARIAYIGQFRTDEDLKPGRGGLQGLSESIFGKDPAHALLTPMAVCSDGDRIFIADSNAQLVHVMDLATRKYQQWKPPKEAAQFSQPVAVAYDAVAKRLLVSDSVGGLIVSFDATGKYLGVMGEGWLQRPCGLVVDNVGERILVVDAGTHQVAVLGISGEHLNRIGSRGSGPGQFNYPTNIALDSRRLIYISDSLNFRVQVFDADFKPLQQLGKKGDLPGYFAQPKGLAVDAQDRLFVVDANFEAVQLFDCTEGADGKLLMTFGHEGQGPGEFWLPAGIHIDAAGRIWVADSYNKRIQVFEQLAETEGQQ